MKTRTFPFNLFVFLSLVVIANTTSAQNSEFEFRGIYLFPGGETSFSTTQTPGTTISFGRDFDLPNRFGIDARYTYRTPSGKHKFTVGYTRSSFESTRTLTRTIEFLNQVFTANLEITSERKLQSFSGMYAYRWGNEKIRIGPMADLGVVDVSVEISTFTNNAFRSSKGSLTKFAALLGYDLDYYPTNRINLFNNVGGIAYKNDRLFRAEGGGRFFLAEHFGVSGGYQFVNYKFVDGVNFIRARQHGPFIGGVVRF